MACKAGLFERDTVTINKGLGPLISAWQQCHRKGEGCKPEALWLFLHSCHANLQLSMTSEHCSEQQVSGTKDFPLTMLSTHALTSVVVTADDIVVDTFLIVL